MAQLRFLSTAFLCTKGGDSRANDSLGPPLYYGVLAESNFFSSIEMKRGDFHCR